MDETDLEAGLARRARRDPVDDGVVPDHARVHRARAAHAGAAPGVAAREDAIRAAVLPILERSAPEPAAA